MDAIGHGAVPSPRERAFLEELLSRGREVVQATYERTSENSREISVHRGEYLEVLNDNANWWRCKNMDDRVGFVPHTILTLVGHDAIEDLLSRRRPDGRKIVRVTYDRTSLNSKEISVHRGEYLEVLNDNVNWWECKNGDGRVGYVPHTILTLVGHDAIDR